MRVPDLTLDDTRPFVRQGVFVQTLRDSFALLRPRGFPILFLFALNGYALGAPAHDWPTRARPTRYVGERPVCSQPACSR